MTTADLLDGVTIGSRLVSLEEHLGRGCNSVSRNRQQPPVRWSPPSASTLRRYEQLPVVMIVSSLAHSRLRTALYRAVEVLQEGTYAFRTVVVVDARIANEAREYDFRVDTFFSEWDWLNVSSTPWMNMAVDRVNEAVIHFGADELVSVFDRKTWLAHVQRIALKYRASREVTNAALRMLDLVSVPDESGERPTLRGADTLEGLKNQKTWNISLGVFGRAEIENSQNGHRKWIIDATQREDVLARDACRGFAVTSVKLRQDDSPGRATTQLLWQILTQLAVMHEGDTNCLGIAVDNLDDVPKSVPRDFLMGPGPDAATIFDLGPAGRVTAPREAYEDVLDRVGSFSIVDPDGD